MASRFDRLWWPVALLFGVAVLPWLVYVTGLYALGRYAGGGAASFFWDFLRGLATLRWHAWSLALGPLVLVALWRGLWRLTAARD